jgi:hypothetical protein
VLATIPSVGTVYWRYNTSSNPTRFALGFHIFSEASSTGIRFRTRRFTRDRNLQPGDPTVWFPSGKSRVRWLAAISGGEGGAVIGIVRADFRTAGAPSQTCSMYYPPRVTVQFFGHLHSLSLPHGGPGGILRPPIRW